MLQRISIWEVCIIKKIIFLTIILFSISFVIVLKFGKQIEINRDIKKLENVTVK